MRADDCEANTDWVQEHWPVTYGRQHAATPQPDPLPGRDVVADYVLADIEARVAAGEQKYGTKLMTHNGRDPLWDAYQEAIDLVFYLRQAILERDNAPNLGSRLASCS